MRGNFDDPHRSSGSTKEKQAELNEGVVAGRNSVRELLASGKDVDKIYLLSGEREGSVRQIVAIAAQLRIPVIEVNRQKLDLIVGSTAHQGVAAVIPQREYCSVEDILSAAREKGEPPFIVICDGIEDPHNLGAVIRSAECCGAHGIIIPKRRSVGLTPVVSKASAGALEHMPVARVTNIAAEIDKLKKAGIWVFAADMDGQDYFSSDMNIPCAVVLGSEGDGISRLVKEKCDFTVSIPMYGKVNSLNVSNAAAIIFAETARQRHLKKNDSGV